MYLENQEVIQIAAGQATEFDVQVAAKVVDLCRRHDVKPSKFGMDVSGDGGRIGQAIMREWLRHDKDGSSIALISSMGRPTDRIAADVDKRPCTEVYDRLISEYHYSLYHAFKSRVLYGIDSSSDLGRELCLRRYTTKGKKISIETKPDFKGRTGFSCDLADSLTYAIEMGRRNGLVFHGTEKKVPTDRFWARREVEDKPMSDDEYYMSDDDGED